jgi:uncharacterized protein
VGNLERDRFYSKGSALGCGVAMSSNPFTRQAIAPCSRHRKWRAGIVASFSALQALLVLGTSPSEAKTLLDCPLRDQAYSIDSPMIDVLLKPEAKAAVEQWMPNLLARLPPMMTSTSPPAFGSIITVRMMASLAHAPTDNLEPLDHALRGLTITRTDRELRCARYDNERPQFDLPAGHPRLLAFEKITGYKDEPSVQAAHGALESMAQRNGWSLVTTDKGGAINPGSLKQFDAVIWNNVSGDVLTLGQRAALKQFVEAGGGFVAFHGSGGDPIYYWDWYADVLIGARFIGHTMAPQLQDAKIVIEEDPRSIAADLAPGWEMKDEWYSFKTSPRASGAHVIAILDESSYSPRGYGDQDLHMGDHPIAWIKCIGKGRSFYSAIGHRPESYSEVHNVRLLEHGILWASAGKEEKCQH